MIETTEAARFGWEVVDYCDEIERAVVAGAHDYAYRLAVECNGHWPDSVEIGMER